MVWAIRAMVWRPSRREARRAAERVNAVARQQHDLAGGNLHRRPLLEGADHAAGDHEVIGDDLARRLDKGADIVGRDVGQGAPRRCKMRIEEHAAREADRA